MSSTPIFDQLVAEGVIPKQGHPPIIMKKGSKRTRRPSRNKKKVRGARSVE